MDYIDTIVNELDQYVIAEINKHGTPPLDFYNDAINVSIELGKKLNANIDAIKLGVRFMDAKLGEAVSLKKRNEHTNMALGFAMEFLTNFPLAEDIKIKVIACIKEHHDAKFSCIESEICANADCYKFLVPKNILKMFYNMRQRGYNFEEIFLMASEKADEKWSSLTLEVCKKELEPNYHKIKEFLELAKHDALDFMEVSEQKEKKISDFI